ncbi:hypothetical protein ILYODFUR_026243 [Ilyodon furcidens]|uniref:Uncharacterized protein n=1 Tax=Ilyodon furcidens TaxID=33524 RepID=A0ABV0VK05_9TELE
MSFYNIIDPMTLLHMYITDFIEVLICKRLVVKETQCLDSGYCKMLPTDFLLNYKCLWRFHNRQKCNVQIADSVFHMHVNECEIYCHLVVAMQHIVNTGIITIFCSFIAVLLPLNIM